ncbi:propanediol utilization propanol dehydrogenase pduQ [Salmonella enterica subsp. enterica serovar Typhimurium]|nr:propanediol utilization propanol dehydrogenase pduQ [Salmonella enterica subsp. enterica serovar Typhimurium]
MFQYLPTAVEKGDCVATRGKMHNASTLAGMAFSQAGLGLNHAIAHQLGGQFHLPHGLANALLLTRLSVLTPAFRAPPNATRGWPKPAVFAGRSQ